MKSYGGMTKAELIQALQALQAQARRSVPRRELRERERALRELQTHQSELDAQNRELRQAQSSLEESRNRYADLYDRAPVGLVTLDGKGLVQEINLPGAALLGVERVPLIGSPFGLRVLPSDKQIWREHLRRCRQDQGPQQTELHLVVKDQGILTVELNTVPLRAQARKRKLYLTTLTAVREHGRAEEDASAMQERFMKVFETPLVGIAISRKRDGVFIEVNPGLSAITGYAHDEILGRNSVELGFFTAQDRQRIIADLEREGALYQRELFSHNKAGESRAVSYSLAPITIEGEECLLAMVLDITERKTTEARLKYLSGHDALTGLYNRAYFEEEMARLQAGRQFPVSVVMADLDHLKQVNDQCGHAAGDESLRRAAQVLRAAFRAEDAVSRIGGDEFAALLPGTPEGSAEQVLIRIRRSLALHNAGRTDPPVGLSLGAATAQKGESLTLALKLADERMYRAKQEAAPRPVLPE